MTTLLKASEFTRVNFVCEQHHPAGCGFAYRHRGCHIEGLTHPSPVTASEDTLKLTGYRSVYGFCSMHKNGCVFYLPAGCKFGKYTECKPQEGIVLDALPDATFAKPWTGETGSNFANNVFVESLRKETNARFDKLLPPVELLLLQLQHGIDIKQLSTLHYPLCDELKGFTNYVDSATANKLVIGIVRERLRQFAQTIEKSGPYVVVTKERISLRVGEPPRVDSDDVVIYQTKTA